MRVTVLYRGEPIGTSDLEIHPPFAVGTLEPFATYEALRPIFWEQWRARRNFGYLPPDGAVAGGVDPAGDAAGNAAIARAEEVCRHLEIRPDDGTVAMLESLQIMDLHEQLEITINGIVPDDEDSVAARVPRRPGGDSAANSPAP